MLMDPVGDSALGDPVTLIIRYRHSATPGGDASSIDSEIVLRSNLKSRVSVE